MSILSDKTIKHLCEPVHFQWSRIYQQTLDAKTLLREMAKTYTDNVAFTKGKAFGPGGVKQLGRGFPTLEELLACENGDHYLFTAATGSNASSVTAVKGPPMITPFLPESIRRIQLDGLREFPILSAGLSSYGYDVRLAEEFKIFTNVNGTTIDPKRFDDGCLVDGKLQHDPETGEKWVILPPSGYLLGRTPEWFDMPRDVTVIAVGKSTYARAGAIVNVTPIEAGFKGNVVIEISNPTQLPMRIYANEGCAQFMFFKGDQPCEVSYADRGGKYQNQTGIRLSEV